MTRLQKALIRLSSDLRSLGVRWALVGGFAVILRSESRSTHDLDIVLAVSKEHEADDVVRGLRLLRGYRDHPEQPMLWRKGGGLLGVRLVSPPLDGDDKGSVVDVLLDFSGIETDIVALAERVEVLPNVFIPVAQSGHLVALKILAGRSQDLEDVKVLLREMTDSDLQLARRSLRLIEERGFNEEGSRDLLIELAGFVDSRE